MSAAQIPVPQVVSRKLHAVSGRRRWIAVLAGSALAAALFCGLLLAAMLLDWLTTPFESAPRIALTAAVLLAGTAGWIAWVLRPALEQLSLPSTAGMVDAAVPELEERWTTIAELSQSSDPPEMRGSSAMIGQVAQEAETMQHLVRPQQIVSLGKLGRRIRGLAAVLALFAACWMIDGEQMRVLWQRFWSPSQPISLTQVASPTAGAVVPRNESIDVIGSLTGRIRPNAAIALRSPSGQTVTHAMTASAESPAQFIFPIEKVAAPIEYRIRSGDGQTPWQRIEVADRPRLTRVEFKVTPPAYSRLPVDAQSGLPRRTRVLEGSTLTVTFAASEPLRELNLLLDDHSTVAVEQADDGTYRFERVLTEDFGFSPHLVSRHGLSNENPPACHLIVYRDQYPSVAIVSPQTDYVVRPDDQIEVEFEARDDFGIARAELVITDATHPEDSPLKVVEIPLGEQQNQDAVAGRVPLDLKEFDLKQGSNLSYSVRVFDTKDSTGESRQASSTNSQAQPQQASAQQSNRAEPNPTQQDPADQSPEQSAAESTEENQLARAEPSEPQSPSDPSKTASGQSSPSNTSPSPQSQNSKTAASSQDQPESQPARREGAQRPGDDMSRRSLNLGQCSSCRPMNLKIDEWAGSFAGQQREKLEIAIEEFLARMEAALLAAEQTDQSVFDQVVAGTVWGDGQTVGVRQSASHLGKASDVAVELATTSAGTPYAFMGLQLAEIDERHIVPAQTILQGIPQSSEESRRSELESSLFHIRRARELLARLSRTYESVKVNHQIADAMTHVRTMHQVFIEDTFKLLGSGRPVLNPKQRKFLELELDEEFRNKLKALLEKKRDIQAELAKVLAENPDLLRRYMAQSRVDADSLRDQLTLLARRQVELHAETRSVQESPDAAPAVVAAQKARHLQETVEISQSAALMFENFETWLPRDLQLTDASVEPVHLLYQELATSADLLAVQALKTAQPTEAAPTDEQAEDGVTETPAAEPNHGQRVYEVLNQLQDALPTLLEGRPSHLKLTTHVTNRLAEVGKLTTSISGWLRTEAAFAEGDRELTALIDQTDLTNDTAELTNKLANLKASLAGMPQEIGVMAEELQMTLEDELLVHQATAEEALKAHAAESVERHQALALESFAKAEPQMDRMMAAIIAYLDSLPVNTRPNLDGVDAPTLEELLALLESEKLAAEGLGIPCCRPSNLSIIQDWLSPGKSGGMGASLAAGMLAQAQSAQRRSGQLQMQAQERQRQLLAEMAEAAARQQSAGGRPVNPRWNTLQSRLDDSLNQVRGQALPPKYREAIDLYFELISGVTGADAE